MGNPSLFILRLTFFFIVLIFAFTLLITLGGCISGITSPPSAARGNTWTFMVFLNGDNDLDSEALPDITSMEQVGSTNKVKIVVQYDSLTGGANRYLIQKGDNPFQVQSPKLQDLGEVNMGDGSTLVDFIRFCATNYPADRYALVLWNHGYGFKGGAKDISYDETSLDDALTIPELSLALAEATSIIGHPLDLLGMDACLMALVEVAFEVRNTSRVLVASQENVPGEGWDYAAVLEKLVTQPTMTEKELSPIITESYIRQYPEENVTISAIDLSKMEPLASRISQLSQSILSDPSPPAETYIEIGDSSQFFEGDYDYVDLADLALLLESDSRLPSLVRNAAQEVFNAVNQSVLSNQTSGQRLSRSHGLSIYFPFDPYNPKYDTLSFAQATSWDELLQSLFSARIQREKISPNLSPG